jgi:diguanylate cyclase (GGDEF)-like protein/PAS domain S-box-containing protein
MDPLTIPNRLYGRDREIAALFDSFERVCRGQGEVLLVPGSPGVGKTALVQEVERPIRDRNGLFIQGKFDQYQQSTPYSAIRQALVDLCRQLQSGDSRQRERWQISILQAVGDLGQLLVDLVPEFESLLGTQSTLGEINPLEARHRFADVFRRFLQAICRPEHPLVMFIDDWQWADAASLQLLRQMHVGTDLRYVLVIVAYRDDEVGSAHSLASAVDDLQSQAVPVEALLVKDLGVDDVKMLLDDALRPAADDTDGLAALVHGKTYGNPFFVRSFLGFLQESGLLRLDPARDRWRWRRDEIDAADLPDEVADLFVLKLRRLDADTRSLFSLAACLGNRFDLETLSIISERPLGEVMALLSSPQVRDMLLPWEGGGGDAHAEAPPHAAKECSFVHDRVQQAAYSLIEPAELPRIRLEIGRLLLDRLSPRQLAERSFEVAGNLNAGYSLVRDVAEQATVVELNIAAARRAYAATAYGAALKFYRAASRALQSPGFAEYLWRDRHELAMQLYKGRGECEFLEGDRDAAEDCIRQAAAYAVSDIERADALSILIVHLTLLARYPEAIAAGRRALAALGISLPVDDYETARDDEIAQVREELGGRPVSSLMELPLMSDPEVLMASKILITMGPPCYRSHQRLWAVIVPRVVSLTLRYGNIPEVGYSHTAFGGLLGWVDDDYATAGEFGELATRLMTSTFRSPSDQSVFCLMIGSSIRHWFKHLKYSTLDYTDAYEIGLQSGNLQYAAYAFGHNMYCRFYQAAPLAALSRESRRSLGFSRTRLNQWAIDLLEGGLEVFDTLSGEKSDLDGRDAWSEEGYLRRVMQHENTQVACIYGIIRSFSLLVLGDHHRALALSDEAEQLLYTVGTQGLLPWPEHVCARLLILTALYPTADAEKQAEWRPELERMMDKLRVWAGTCPDNFEHMYHLAAAELARIDGRPLDAVQLYDRAVEGAQSGGFLQWEAIANERASSFWLERGNGRLAQVYWQQAYVCYDNWGAGAKVRVLEAACREALGDGLRFGQAAARERETGSALSERQIALLRRHASQVQQARLQAVESTQAEEQAAVATRLRSEIAARKEAEAALRESEARYRTVLNTSPDGIVTTSVEGRILMVSPGAVTMFGCERDEELLGRLVTDVIVPEDRERAAANVVLTFEGNGPGPSEYGGLRADGSTFDFEANGECIRDGDGRAVQMVSIVRDITERKRAESYREMGREVLETLNEPGSVQESLRRVLEVLQAKTGFDAVGIRLQDGEDFPYFTQEGLSAEFLRTENTLLERGADGEVCRDQDGRARLECTCGLVISGDTDPSSPLFTPGGSFWSNDSFPLIDLPSAQDPRHNPRNQCIHHGYASFTLVPIRSTDRIVGLIHFADQRKGRFSRDTVELLEGIASHLGAALLRQQAEEALTRLNDELVAEASVLARANAFISRIAATDHLTGLANRRHFSESLDRAVSLARRHGSPVSLVSFDLDGLKRVNDASGHEAGDEALTTFTALLTTLCRAEDLPSRLGGDEFSVLLPGVDLAGAWGFAERVLVAVRSSPALARLHVTVSAGVARWAPDERPDEFLRRADEALYAAKRGGGDAAAHG